MNDIEKYSSKIFENIRHIDEDGNEYWYARELQKVLEYSQWRRFESTIIKAKESCEGSKYKVSDHFANVGKMVEIGSNTKRNLIDYKLSRYACYLIVMNGDSRKEVIALGQTYFAVQTRKQELLEEKYSNLNENEKRLLLRCQTKNGNISLNLFSGDYNDLTNKPESQSITIETNITSSSTNNNPAGAAAVYSYALPSSAKSTIISSSSTNDEIPSAKAVWDLLETFINEVIGGEY